MSSSYTKPFDFKNALKTKDSNKRLALSEISKIPSCTTKSGSNKDDTKGNITIVHFTTNTN